MIINNYFIFKKMGMHGKQTKRNAAKKKESAYNLLEFNEPLNVTQTLSQGSASQGRKTKDFLNFTNNKG